MEIRERRGEDEGRENTASDLPASTSHTEDWVRLTSIVLHDTHPGQRRKGEGVVVWWVGVMGFERAYFVRVEEPRTSHSDSDCDQFMTR